ncbi:hypothetical protein CCACVL1_15267 [Corchorus capsularis]|uniref:Protein FAR1-RELATED SEQUENCE n=1 Tax=Corchorus capsularis TaxID=210143 RepID=A0A1R3I316_COCAP|nr:hypothetical protein CCACVL1_15267 [Corchorus capsularis]
MTSVPSKNIWIRRQQCPCGDWKCYVTYEGDAEETSVASELVKTESVQSEAMVAPYVGMVFKTDEEAFEYYGNFARKNGFSIRKERSRLSPQLGVYKRDFVCYRSGFAPMRKKPTGEHHRDRKSDETPRSFAWALQTFIRFMKGRCPQTILTDLDPGLRDAIRSELLNTKHVTPIWHILPKVSSWFPLQLGSQYAEFKSEFDALYHLESTEDFELRWNQMVSIFGLGSDKHIALLYSLRTSWVLSYVRGFFLARMATTSYSKSVDAFLKGIFSAQTCLRRFFEQVGVAASTQNQPHQEMQYMHMKTCLPIEEHSRQILTPFAFNVLQHELIVSMQYAASEMANGSYLVRHFRKVDGESLVIWIPEDEQIHCSCKEFESSGILCRHALRVFIDKNYFQLPEKYFVSRWRRDSSLVFYDDHSIHDNDDEWFQEFQSLTETLFTESSLTKERSDYVRRELTKELTRLLNEVRDMPESDGAPMDFTLSPTG